MNMVKISKKTVVRLITFLTAFVFPALGEEIAFMPESNITIKTQGALGGTEAKLAELLEKYLLKATGKKELKSAGQEIAFIIQSKAMDWSDMPPADLIPATNIDSFEIEISRTPKNQVIITWQTALAAGFGVMHFLEKYLGILWAFPGELGVCLPKEKSFKLAVGKEKVSPYCISRLFTGFVYVNQKTKAQPPTESKLEGVLYDHRSFF